MFLKNRSSRALLSSDFLPALNNLPPAIRPVIESLENRLLLSLTMTSSLAPILATPSQPSANNIDLSSYFSDPQITGTVVEFDTTSGTIDVALTDNATPNTVSNFLSYVNGTYDSSGNYTAGTNGQNAYNGTFFHRSAVLATNQGPVPGQDADIFQGGGYILYNGQIEPINTGPQIADEYSTEVQGNVPGTIAMATTGPNTATSQFYFNVNDNSSTLDGMYTTFGSIIGNGMSVLDALAALPTLNAAGFPTLPVTGLTESQVLDPNTQLQADNLVYLNSIKVVPGITYTVSSDNTALVSPTISDNTLSFTYGAGLTGLANITLTATSLAGGTSTETFAVTVPNPALPTQGPVAVSYTAPDIITNTPTTELNVLANDTDSTAALNPRTVTVTTQPSHGLATVNSSTGQITYTLAADYTGTDSFQYTVSDASGNTSAPATVTLNIVPVPVQVSIGAHTGLSGLVYTQPNGTVGRLTLTNGTADITFRNYQVTDTKSNGIVFAKGAGATITSISVTPFNANFPGTLTLTASHGTATVGSISDTTGALLSLIATHVEITSAINLSSIKRLTVSSTDNATITITGNAFRTTLSIGSATDTNVTAAGELLKVISGQWLNTNAGTYSIAAPAIGSLVNSGVFDEDVTLNANGLGITSARVGQLTGGTWNITGPVGSISANSVQSAWSLSAQNLVRTLRFRGNFSSSITAGAIGTMTVGGNMSDNVIQVEATISKKFPNFDEFDRLAVRGAIDQSVIFANGNLGTISATSLVETNIYAGVNLSVAQNQGFPTSASDLSANAYIAAVRLSGANPSFSDSKISAQRLDSLRLGIIEDPTVSGNVDGVAGVTIGSITGTLSGGTKLSLGHAQLKTATTWSSYLSAKKITLIDFGINII